QDDFEPRTAGFAPPHEFDQSDVITIAPDPMPRRERFPAPGASAPNAAGRRATSGSELESALRALDVDLDDLSTPRARSPARRETPGYRTGSSPVTPPPRGTPGHQSGSSQIATTPRDPKPHQSGSSQVVAPPRGSPGHQSGSSQIVTAPR